MLCTESAEKLGLEAEALASNLIDAMKFLVVKPSRRQSKAVNLGWRGFQGPINYVLAVSTVRTTRQGNTPTTRLTHTRTTASTIEKMPPRAALNYCVRQNVSSFSPREREDLKREEVQTAAEAAGTSLCVCDGERVFEGFRSQFYFHDNL